MSIEFTARQLEFLRAIEDFRTEHGYPPTYRDLCAVFGVTRHSAFCVVRALRTKGALRPPPHPNAVRAMILTEEGLGAIGKRRKARRVPIARVAWRKEVESNEQ